MAELVRDGDDLVVMLSKLEKAEALHGDLRFPASSVQRAEVVDDALHAVHGLRAPGTGIPGYVAVGTFRSNGHKTFAVVHHDQRRGVRLEIEGAGVEEVVLSSADPEQLIAGLRLDAER